MAKSKIAPTKTNLFKLKRELSFVQEGHELLKQKREILIAELLGIMYKTKSSQKKIEEELKEAYIALEEVIIKMGRKSAEQASLSVNLTTSITLHRRGIMGVELPLVETKYDDNPPYYGLKGTSPYLDEVINRFKEVLQLIGQHVQDRLSLLRLAREVKKTIHRVNALEKISIPDYKETTNYIQETLEEQERENFIVAKLIKKRLEKRFKDG
ncbi:V-type ATP synthase subunit D [bacterium]|nr:V-type ATP synthase subunit D [bacterium]